MQIVRTARWKGLLIRHRYTLLEGSLLLAALSIAGLLAFEYNIFFYFNDATLDERVIELDEALALGTALCLGLLVLSWRFMLSQRREVTRRIEAERKARNLAMQDSLTGLPNRRRFDHELKAAIAAPPRIDGTHAVFLLDLNGFKHVNDVYGHGTGDEVLIDVAMRLRRAIREHDLVVRFGGDEFAILARQLSGPEEATSIALRVIQEFSEPIVIGSTSHDVGLGIGIALIPHDANDPIEALRKADIALYRAKDAPGSASRFFEPEMDVHVRERDLIERELRAAIGRGAVVPHFQPLIDLKTKKIVGFEALARWTHPTLGEIAPERFIPIAESSGLITTLTDQILRQAARAARAWPDDVTLAVNLSPVLLKDQTLGLRVLAILGETGLLPSRLEIEITETALVQDLEGAQQVLGALRDAGVRIALDDFGTGYSSLYHLRNFKVDKIKIDRTFIEDMERHPEAFVLLNALLGFGRGLGLTVTAEGVEQPGQAAILLQQGCEQAQGFLFGKAMTADEAAALVGQNETASAGSLGHVT
jgi:diguanylate cyclase (GGDEF)-like protein